MATLSDLEGLISTLSDLPISYAPRNKKTLILNAPIKVNRQALLYILLDDLLKIGINCQYLNKYQCISTAYSSTGALKISIDTDIFYILIKESHNGNSLDDISAKTFISGSTELIIDNNLFYSFDSVTQLENSIIQGCTNSPVIPDTVKDQLSQFFITGTLDFTNIEPKSLINRLGIYLSEILIGWIFLSGRQGEFINGNDGYIQDARVKLFCVPASSNFTDIDSILVLEDDSMISISNKFGSGAPSSLFTSILKYL